MLIPFRLISATMLSVLLSSAAAALSFEPEAIWRTAIASIMDRDPKIMQVTRTDGNVLFLTYVRPMDNFVWTYRCQISGSRVMWAVEPGRWREDPKDEKIYFEIIDAGNRPRIIEDHGDGSTTRQLFDRNMIF